jgi:lysocardiolipin and lysophospholipid acyltransferase
LNHLRDPNSTTEFESFSMGGGPTAIKQNVALMEAFQKTPDRLLNPNRPKPTLLQKLSFLLRAFGLLLITLSSLLPVWFASLVFKPLLGQAFYRRFADVCQQHWLDFMFGMLRNPRLHLTGDYTSLQAPPSPTNTNKTRVIIANHTTDVDWIFLFLLAHASPSSSQAGNVKVLLKDGIRHLPLMGKFIDLLDFIWIKRNWEEDQSFISQRLQSLTCQGGSPVILVLFPEGMTINTRSVEKSHSFALQEARPNLELTLLPRHRGLQTILDGLREYEIYDITMTFQGYSGEVPTWEMGYERNEDFLIPNVQKLIYGMEIGDCYLDVQRFDSLAPTTSLQQWLDERWQVKDDLLKHFVKNQQFRQGEVIQSPQGHVMKRGGLMVIQIMLFKWVMQWVWRVRK